MSVNISDLNKAFGEHKVLTNLNMTLEDNGIYCLMGPSGMGKTTLLRIIMGLETKDSGTIEGAPLKDISVMFQENRLCEVLTPVENVALICNRHVSRKSIHDMLSAILPEECLTQPVSELSGGMKRRVALARALAYPGKIVIMDEPFTGLDINTKKDVINFILKEQKGRILLISTHGEEDVSLLNATRIRLEDIMSV